ncbi:hypothetical protein FACS1894127_0320 [Clostridia bacterium]|nr:hypothetical protein FACS1894127_0320 [Clostridia bacterium]
MNSKHQSTKAYLSGAYRIDRRISSKLEQVASLRELASRASAVLSDMPVDTTKNPHRMEGIIVDMMELETDIKADISFLIDLKREVMRLIKRVGSPECQTLLELRYLCFKTWEQIAVELDYGIDNVFRLHRRALEIVTHLRSVQ